MTELKRGIDHVFDRLPDVEWETAAARSRYDAIKHSVTAARVAKTGNAIMSGVERQRLHAEADVECAPLFAEATALVEQFSRRKV